MGNHMASKGFSLKGTLKYHLLEKKLNTVAGFIVLGIIGALMVSAIVLVDKKIGFVCVGAAAGFLLLIAIMKYPYFGFYFLLVFAALSAFLGLFVTLPLPLGILVEVLTYIVLLSILLKHDLKRNIDLRFWTNPVAWGLYIQFAYYFIELFNPAMFSQLGWFSFFRKQLSYITICYIVYCLFDSKERILYFVHFMIGLSTVCALYACKQQWFGYAGYELNALGADGYNSLIQGGMVRKFSVFTDPATSGILFASITMLCLILIIRTNKPRQRWWLSACAFFNLLGYTYSGTRTATLMVVAGIILYCIATLNERITVIFFVCSSIFFAGLMVLPFQNVEINRIRSTFEGTKDASAAVRDYDRHEVQPYLHEHLLGGGIFTCGIEGPKYNEGHYLEKFQPDSGYMKCLAEQGAIGLALMLLFNFIIMRVGFRNFFRVKDPEIKNYYIALLIMMFTLLVAQFSQLAIAQYPVTLFFFANLMVFIKLADFDKEPKTQNNQI